MSRRPRSTEAASERRTIRFTKTELEAAEALAEHAGTDLASFVRQLLAEAAHPSDKGAPSTPSFIDARHSFAVLKSYGARWPVFVFTLHYLPGMDEPICVRRKVRGIDDDVTFEYARGTCEASFVQLFDELEANGQVLSCGAAPRMAVYRDPPSEGEIDAWKLANTRWQAIIKAPSFTVWTCWNGRFQSHQAKRVDQADQADEEGLGRRGIFQIKLDRTHSVMFDAFGLAWQVTSHFQCLVKAPGGGKCLSASFKVWLEKPFADEAELECQAQAAAQRQRQEEQQRHRYKQAEEQASGHRWTYPGPSGSIRPPNESLDLLGISWPCTEDELKTAHRQKVLDHHPDRGGDGAKMASINAARDRIASFIRPPESRAS